MGGTRTRHEVPVVPAAEVLRRADAVVVDLRSPAEFASDHLPGAVNAPLLDDVARALVGRLYGRVSPEAAFDEAREIVRDRVVELAGAVFAAAGEPPPVRGIEALYEGLTAEGLAGLEEATAPRPAPSPERPVVLHCWRGGLRSRSVVALVRALGLRRAVGLARGYKGYREEVRAELEGWQAPPTFVLRGLTGVGKTLVLRELERQRPGWTLDLEAAAGHRSSILGSVGLAPVSQKAFESALATRQRRGLPGPLVVEGESRKVGDAIIPPRLWEAMEGGASIELTAPTPRRVEVLVQDYLASEERRAELRTKLPFLERRLGPRAWTGRLVALLDARRDEELAALLLERYYDPLYRHSESRHAYATTIEATDPGRAAADVAAWIEARWPDRETLR
jgi:tRNA 2-selenouridine synthase